MTSASVTGKAHSPKNLAVDWSCSVRHIYRLIASGQLGSVKIGSLRRVPEAEVQRFIAEHFLPPTTEEPQRRRMAGPGNVATIADVVIGRQRRGAR